MKKLSFIFYIIYTLFFSGFAQDPAEGYWLSYDEKTNAITAGWKIYVNSEGNLEGVIVYAPGCDSSTLAEGCKDLKPVNDFPVEGDFSKMKILNETPWIFGLEKTSEGVWENGSIIDPSEGKKYNCKITFVRADGRKFKNDSLMMRGSLGPVGKNQIWIRPDIGFLKNQLAWLSDYVKAFSDFIELVQK